MGIAPIDVAEFGNKALAKGKNSRPGLRPVTLTVSPCQVL